MDASLINYWPRSIFTRVQSIIITGNANKLRECKWEKLLEPQNGTLFITPNLPGRYMRNVKLLAGSTNTSQTFGQNIRDIYISYTVSSPPCRLDSARNMTLEFQTLNSNDFASAQQYANILLSCTTPTQVTASLNPVQNPIAGLQGVSATSLEGLNMATTWADSNAAVIFGYPRSMSLRKGDNTISLGFKPKLNSSASPTGYFSSQYTLNIVYL